MSLNIRPYLLLILLALLPPSLSVQAQEIKVVRDLHLWTGAALEKSWKDWSLTVSEEVRFKQDISQLNNYFTELGLRYRINKNFSLEGGYRFTRDKNRDGTYDNLSRYNLDLRFKGSLEHFSVHYRLRYQKEVEGFNLMDPSITYEKYVRNRIRVRYDRYMKIKPYVSAELFQLFRPEYVSKLEYMRVLGGIRYEAGSLGAFNFAFGFNREFSRIEPATIYLFKVHYTYQL